MLHGILFLFLIAAPSTKLGHILVVVFQSRFHLIDSLTIRALYIDVLAIVNVLDFFSCVTMVLNFAIT